MEYRVKPKDKKSPVIYTVPKVPLNKSFSYTLQMDKQGQLSVLIGNSGKQVKLDKSWQGYDFYFKAGVYTLDNKGYSNEGGKSDLHQTGRQPQMTDAQPCLCFRPLMAR
nr:hypothetical protein GCM10020185_65640 [Pseudomonas brassicacearum subsp. brassicacearum]